MKDMDWEDKFEALNGLVECHIGCMSQPNARGMRFSAILRGINIKDGAFLMSCNGFGLHIFQAVENLWDNCVTNLKPEQYLVKDSFSDTKRRHFRWNGFMWKEE